MSLLSYFTIFSIVVYVVVVGLISFTFYDRVENKMTLEDAIWVAAWPLIVLIAPFYITYVLWKDRPEKPETPQDNP